MARPRQEAASVPLSSVTERERKPAFKRTDQRDAIFAALCEAICPVFRAQTLAAFDAATLTQAIQQQPQTFVRLVQTLPSLSRGGMDCERLLVELAQRKASLDSEKHPRKRMVSASIRMAEFLSLRRFA